MTRVMELVFRFKGGMVIVPVENEEQLKRVMELARMVEKTTNEKPKEIRVIERRVSGDK